MAIKKSKNKSQGLDDMEVDMKGNAEKELEAPLGAAETHGSELPQGTLTSTETDRVRISGGVRSVCALEKVVVKKGVGKRQKVTYNDYGIPNGRRRHKLQSYIGMLARTMVPIDIPTWPKVDKETKDKIWADIQVAFKVAPESERLLLRSAGAKWRQFKAILTTHYVLPYIDQKRKLSKPPRKYHYVGRDTWNRFVAQRTNPKWLEINKKQSEAVGKRKYHHRLSRKGYIGLQEEEIKKGALEPGEIPDRAYLWKKARKVRDMEVDADLVQVHQKIDTLLEQKNKGEFKPSGCEDVLAAALETREHSGHVRGVGSFVNPTTYFNLPKGKRIRITKAELMARDKQRAQEMDRKTEEMDRKTEEMERKTERLEQEIVQLKALVQSMAVDHQSVPSPKFSEKASFYPQKEEIEVMIQKSSSVGKQLSLEDTCIQNHAKQVPRSCDLSVDNIDNKVAFGTVFPSTEDNLLIHGQPLQPGHVIVSVDGVVIPDAKLPVPLTGVLDVVQQALGSHVAWPEALITYKIPLNNSKRKSVGAQSKKAGMRVQNVFEDVKLNENVPIRYKLLYNNAINIMKESGASLQIPCDVQVFGVDKTIFILHESLLALCHFDKVGQAVISAYMAYLHTLVRKTDEADTFAFVDPGATYYLNSEFEAYMVKRFKEGNPDRMFLVPHNENEHWILTLIWEDEVYVLNPLPGAHPYVAWEKALVGAIKKFKAESGRGTKLPKIKYLPGAPKQPGGTECGYSVMHYMREIVNAEEPSACISKWMTKTRSTYKMEQLNEVRMETLDYIDSFA